MEINVTPPATQPPVDRAFLMTMVINSFKGRKDVDLHLFRPLGEDAQAQAEAYDWTALVDTPHHPNMDDDIKSAQAIVLEAFTEAERDSLLQWIKAHYEGRVSQVDTGPMSFPVPLGMMPLSNIPEGKTIGKVRFEKIPSFDLPFAVHGFYDLSQHKPLVEEGED